MFRAYLINRHFKKRKVGENEVEEIELTLTRLRILPPLPSSTEALKLANVLYPHFRGRLCVGVVHSAHHHPELKHASPAPEVVAA